MCQKACLCSVPCVRKPVYAPPMCQKTCWYSIPCVRKPVYAPPMCQKTCLYSTPCVRKPVSTPPHVSESLSMLHPMFQKAYLYSAPCVRKPVYTLPHVSEVFTVLHLKQCRHLLDLQNNGVASSSLQGGSLTVAFFYSSLSSRQAIVQCPVFPQTELQAPQHFQFFSCFSALCTACYMLSVCMHLCESNYMSLWTPRKMSLFCFVKK